MPDGTMIVCMLADQAVVVSANSTMDRCCSECARRVVLAPSSRRLMVEEATAQLLCTECFASRVTFEEVRPVASGEELLHELRHSVPNTWRGRN